METTISKYDFFEKYTQTGVRRNAIFGSRKALMEELYATAPIYCDQSYYVNCQELHRVIKDGDSFRCGDYTHFENWRDCHYYIECFDKDGNRAWFMTGGRYD